MENNKSNKCNTLEHVPPCAIWPPSWLVPQPDSSVPISESPIVDTEFHQSASNAEVWHPTVPTVPTGAEVFIADADSYINEHRKGEPYMWTYEGAPTWYYVADHPQPLVREDAIKPKNNRRVVHNDNPLHLQTT